MTDTSLGPGFFEFGVVPPKLLLPFFYVLLVEGDVDQRGFRTYFYGGNDTPTLFLDRSPKPSSVRYLYSTVRWLHY